MEPVELAFWRNLSVIWLALLFFIFSLIPLAIFYFAVRGMNAVNNGAQSFFNRAKTISNATRERTQTISDRIAEPIVHAQGQATKAETVARALATGDDPSKSTGSTK